MLTFLQNRQAGLHFKPGHQLLGLLASGGHFGRRFETRENEVAVGEPIGFLFGGEHPPNIPHSSLDLIGSRQILLYAHGLTQYTGVVMLGGVTGSTVERMLSRRTVMLHAPSTSISNGSQ
jgi:hypothetical protein